MKMGKEISKTVEVCGKKIKLNTPTIGMGAEGDLEYSKAYTKSLIGGLMPRAAMEKFVRESKSWTDEDDTRLSDVMSKLQELMAQFGTEKDNDKRQDLRLSFYETRNELANLTARRQSLFAHTAESKGEEAKVTNLAWKCITNEDGSKIWNTQEQFLAETDVEFVGAALQEFISFTTNLEEKMSELDEIIEGDYIEEKEPSPVVADAAEEEEKEEPVVSEQVATV